MEAAQPEIWSDIRMKESRQFLTSNGGVLFKGDMKMPPKIQDAMQMQVEAERRKRATILESEGER